MIFNLFVEIQSKQYVEQYMQVLWLLFISLDVTVLDDNMPARKSLIKRLIGNMNWVHYVRPEEKHRLDLNHKHL